MTLVCGWWIMLVYYLGGCLVTYDLLKEDLKGDKIRVITGILFWPLIIISIIYFFLHKKYRFRISLLLVFLLLLLLSYFLINN